MLICVCVTVCEGVVVWCVWVGSSRSTSPLSNSLELLLKAVFQLQQLLINVCILNPSQ